MLSSPITFAVLTVSDRCSQGITVDTTGPALCRMLEEKLQALCLDRACVPDEVDRVGQVLVRWAKERPRPDLILTTGGTGLAPRDLTPEATAAVLERRHDSLMELARLRCYAKTPRAYLSRGIAGTIASSLVINLPGSMRGATENLEALLDILPHGIETLRGEVQDDGRAGAAAVSGRVVVHAD